MNNIYRPNGNGVKCSFNTKYMVVHVMSSELYNTEYKNLSHTSKKVLESVFKFMTVNMNTINIGGDTLKSMIDYSGYSEKTIRNQVSEICKTKILEHTSNRGEYIVNPLIAYKGDYKEVWRTYGEVEIQLGNKNATIYQEEQL